MYSNKRSVLIIATLSWAALFYGSCAMPKNNGKTEEQPVERANSEFDTLTVNGPVFVELIHDENTSYITTSSVIFDQQDKAVTISGAGTIVLKMPDTEHLNITLADKAWLHLAQSSAVINTLTLTATDSTITSFAEWQAKELSLKAEASKINLYKVLFTEKAFFTLEKNTTVHQLLLIDDTHFTQTFAAGSIIDKASSLFAYGVSSGSAYDTNVLQNSFSAASYPRIIMVGDGTLPDKPSVDP